VYEDLKLPTYQCHRFATPDTAKPMPLVHLVVRSLLQALAFGKGCDTPLV
jgi:hypothetical protein